MSITSKLAQFGKKHIAKGIGRATELVIEKGKGTYVYALDGKKYLDLSTGIGVTNTGIVFFFKKKSSKMFRHSLGHCHPTVVKAVQEQAANLSHGQVNIFYQKPMLDLIKGLLPKMPSSKLDTFFFGTQVLKQSKPLSNSPVMPPKSKTSLCFKDPITAVPLVRWL